MGNIWWRRVSTIDCIGADMVMDSQLPAPASEVSSRIGFSRLRSRSVAFSISLDSADVRRNAPFYGFSQTISPPGGRKSHRFHAVIVGFLGRVSHVTDDPFATERRAG